MEYKKNEILKIYLKLSSPRRRDPNPSKSGKSFEIGPLSVRNEFSNLRIKFMLLFTFVLEADIKTIGQ